METPQIVSEVQFKLANTSPTVRVYYAFLPEGTDRPGGRWWYRDFHNHSDVCEFVEDVSLCVNEMRFDYLNFIEHDGKIEPPAGCFLYVKKEKK